MKNLKTISVRLVAAPLALAVIAACSSPVNPQLGQGAEPDQRYTATSGETQAAKIPAVDILFVVDDSDSMTKHLASVHENMDTFAKQFAGSSNVDYHVGLVKVFDSTRYGTPKVPQFVPNGELQNDALDKSLVAQLLAKTPAASDADKQSAVESSAKWVARSQSEKDNEENLRALLAFNTKTIANGGPNKEEIFSPIVSALVNPAASSARNAGFLRPDANLAVIILTDAEDSSPQFMNPNDPLDKSYVSQVHDLIKAAKGDASKVSIYAALAGHEADGSNCAMDIDRQQPDKIKALIESFHGSTAAAKAAHEFNLCGDFGSTMKKVGYDINLHATVDNVIPLPAPLDEAQMASVVVTYGSSSDNTIVKPGDWVYDRATNSIQILRGPAAKAGAKFSASYLGMSQKELIRRQKLQTNQK